VNQGKGRAWFFEHKNDMWRAANWVVDKPSFSGTPDEQLDWLMHDLALRELLTSYTDAFDAKDLPWTMSHFAADCVLVNPRATFVGPAQVEEFYRQAMIGTRVSFHRVQNVIVRPGDEAGEAWLSAYFHAPFVWPLTTMGTSQLGRYFGRAVLEDGRWQFADWRISVDFMPAYTLGSAG
jgi:hypothetical protein